MGLRELLEDQSYDEHGRRLPAHVHYHIAETNGFVNMDLAAGAIFVMVVPDWASADTNQLGCGPGATGTLVKFASA